MAGLVNFQPLLSSYRPDAGADRIERGLREAGQAISRGIEQAGARGREREKQFESMFDVDVSKVTDMESKQYIIDKYRRLKSDYVGMFQKNRNWLGYGKLPPEHRIELRGSLDSLKSEAEMLKQVDKSLIDANSVVGKSNLHEIDNELKEEYSEAKRTGDTDKMAAVMQKLGESESGTPFVKYKNINPDSFIDGYVKEVQSKMDKHDETVRNEYEKNGKYYIESETTSKHGNEDEAKKHLYSILVDGDGGQALEVNLRRQLSEEEMAEALELYQGETLPLTKYYVETKANVQPMVYGGTKTSTTTKPVAEKKDKTGRGSWDKIAKTDIGWDYGALPITYENKIEATDGNTYNRGKNVGIELVDGEYQAKFKVRVDPEEEKRKVNDKIDAEIKERYDKESEGVRWGKGKLKSKIVKEVNAKYESQLQEASKTEEKYVYTPLKNVYHEIQDRLTKSNMYLEGLDQIDFTKQRPGIKKETTTYNLDGAEYTEQELIDAGWTQDDLKRLK